MIILAEMPTSSVSAFFSYPTCGIHFFAGGAEYRRLRPGPARADAGKAFDYWLTGHGVFHMVSADLLLGAVFCLLMGAKIMGFHFWLILFIALLHAFYALFWLGKIGRAHV